ncbi:MAG: hypothetical protein ACPH3C_08430 [Glaciecola sp.]
MKNLESYGYYFINENSSIQVMYRKNDTLLDFVLMRKQEERVFQLTCCGWQSVSGHKVDLRAIHSVVEECKLEASLNGEFAYVALNAVTLDFNYNKAVNC